MRPALSHPRPRHLVWRRGHPAAASHGHSRPADHATLTVAKRPCRTADRLDPTRMPRPCRGGGGKAPPSSVGELRDLLQPGAYACCARQGCSAPSTGADSRAYRISHLARRPPPALRSDGIIGRHSPVKTGKGENVKYVETVIDPGVADKRLLVIESEFARTMMVIRRDGNTLSPVIRDAWDRGALAILTKNSPAQATGAHISIIGHITTDELRRNLDSTALTNGFANRFL